MGVGLENNRCVYSNGILENITHMHRLLTFKFTVTHLSVMAFS